MIGQKKLSTIRAELQAALAAERSNPIAALDRKLRKLGEKPNGDQGRSLVLLRDALAQIAKDPPQRRKRTPRTKRPKKTITRS